MAGRKAAINEVKEVAHHRPTAAAKKPTHPEVPATEVAKPVAKDPRGSVEERVGRIEAILKRHGLFHATS